MYDRFVLSDSSARTHIRGQFSPEAGVLRRTRGSQLVCSRLAAECDCCGISRLLGRSHNCPFLILECPHKIWAFLTAGNLLACAPPDRRRCANFVCYISPSVRQDELVFKLTQQHVRNACVIPSEGRDYTVAREVRSWRTVTEPSERPAGELNDR